MASNDTDKSVFVVTFPLKTEAWQEYRINNMMRLLTVFYNEKQKKLVEKWLHIHNSAEYKEHKAENARNSLILYMREFGFSEFGFKELFKDTHLIDSPYARYGLNSAILRNLAKFASKPHKHTMFTIPFAVNRNSEYEAFALGEIQSDSTKLRNLSIVRKEIRGKYTTVGVFCFPLLIS